MRWFCKPREFSLSCYFSSANKVSRAQKEHKEIRKKSYSQSSKLARGRLRLPCQVTCLTRALNFAKRTVSSRRRLRFFWYRLRIAVKWFTPDCVTRVVCWPLAHPHFWQNFFELFFCHVLHLQKVYHAPEKSTRKFVRKVIHSRVSWHAGGCGSRAKLLGARDVFLKKVF